MSKTVQPFEKEERSMLPYGNGFRGSLTSTVAKEYLPF